MKNSKNNNSKKTAAVKKPAKKLASKKVASTNGKVAKKGAKPPRYFVFGFPLSHVNHKLGKLGWKSRAAYEAIKRMPGCKNVLLNTMRTQVQIGKQGLKSKPYADLSKTQIAKLSKLAATAAA